ncbi:MAG TPA: hypothetical protein VK893_14275 [Pyrinomonadaceae bacterium]|nr:hypothetical protein [Pyrinomonadaceae bacterium]
MPLVWASPLGDPSVLLATPVYLRAPHVGNETFCLDILRRNRAGDFDAIAQVIGGGNSSTTALNGSTEEQ